MNRQKIIYSHGIRNTIREETRNGIRMRAEVSGAENPVLNDRCKEAAQCLCQ